MTAQRFAAARAGCFLTIEQTAKLLRVSERTLHNWEAGRVRIPYAAYKLIRILRGYELPGDAWKGYRLIGDTLWSPENLPFHAGDARWWSLTAQMAHEYRRQSKAKQDQRRAENGAPAKVENLRTTPKLLKSSADNKSGASVGRGRFTSVPSGLVSLTTSQTETSKNQQKCGFQPSARADVRSQPQAQAGGLA
ncbi:MAG TPA: VC1465 family Xer recombination activation factor [Arenimonas sp.]|nr:VC1465 family Xer recombination activation factor [Arenimonas sp.]HPW31757.1 VC1465 family Xer recombination activation factor [Arenimonas sp.]